LKTHKKIPALRLLVLLPHRDSQNIITNYRQELFAAGFKGAYSFPAAAPLAILSKPFDRDELKHTAGTIREATLSGDGKITAAGFKISACPGLLKTAGFFGPVLDLQLSQCLSENQNEKINFIFTEAVLCAAVVDTLSAETTSPGLAESGEIADTGKSPPVLKQFCFRAARIANMAIRPLEDGAAPYSFEWRLGPECWLPSYRRKK